MIQKAYQAAVCGTAYSLHSIQSKACGPLINACRSICGSLWLQGIIPLMPGYNVAPNRSIPWPVTNICHKLRHTNQLIKINWLSQIDVPKCTLNSHQHDLIGVCILYATHIVLYICWNASKIKGALNEVQNISVMFFEVSLWSLHSFLHQ